MSTPLSADEIRSKLEGSPFAAFLGFRVLSADPARQELAVYLPMRPECERVAGTGQWHGGPIAAAIDTIGDFALIMILGRPLPTINFRIDYLRPAIDSGLRVIARVRRAGRSVGVVDVEVLDDSDKLIALGRCTYSTREDQ